MVPQHFGSAVRTVIMPTQLAAGLAQTREPASLVFRSSRADPSFGRHLTRPRATITQVRLSDGNAGEANRRERLADYVDLRPSVSRYNTSMLPDRPVGVARGFVPAVGVVVVAAYIAAQMLADIASLKIVALYGFSIDAGTFIYPLTFTLRDLVHKTLGARVARILIGTAAVINLIMAAFFWFVARLPGDPAVGPQLEFGLVLAPTWRIVVASIAAELISELTDTEIYRLWVQQITRRYQWVRVLVSNAVSVPLDSVIFAWLAFGGVLAVPVVWAIVVSNILIKGVTTLVSLPAIYLVPGD